MKFPRVCMPRHSVKLSLLKSFPCHSEYINFYKSTISLTSLRKQNIAFRQTNHPECSEILFCVFRIHFAQSWIHHKAGKSRGSAFSDPTLSSLLSHFFHLSFVLHYELAVSCFFFQPYLNPLYVLCILLYIS